MSRPTFGCPVTTKLGVTWKIAAVIRNKLAYKFCLLGLLRILVSPGHRSHTMNRANLWCANLPRVREMIVRSVVQVEKAGTIENSCNSHWLIRNTGPPRTSISEVNKESKGTLIYSQTISCRIGQNTLGNTLVRPHPQWAIHYYLNVSQCRWISGSHGKWRWPVGWVS